MQRDRRIFNFLTQWTEDKSASTFARLLTSRHVADLRLLFFIGLSLTAAGVVIFLLLQLSQKSTSPILGHDTVVAGIIGLGATALARLYLLGSARLGVVDLFACEIADHMPAWLQLLTQRQICYNYMTIRRKSQQNFFSEENYSPVFDTNAKELEVLEARVVERVTEFYTYLKTVRDYRRSLAGIAKPREEEKKWRILVFNVIYMLFLMLESARNSVERLVEYEPEWTLYTSEILLSEIVAYGFLLNYCQREVNEHPDYNAKFERLQLRKENYYKIIEKICNVTKDSKKKDGADLELWDRVTALFRELNKRFIDALGTSCYGLLELTRPEERLPFFWITSYFV